MDNSNTAKATKTVYFVNDRSGKGIGLELLSRAELGTMVRIDPPHIQEQLKQHVHVHDKVVVAGGDGTFSLVIDALFKAGIHDQVCLYLLPLGTGNDLARSLGLADHEHALPQEAGYWDTNFVRSSIPVWRYGDRHFINYLSWGMDAKMLSEIENLRTLFPASLFLRKIAIFLSGLKYLGYLVRTPSAIEIDGKVYRLRGKAGIIISNMPYYLGGSRISTLEPNDKCLSITFIHTAADFIRLGLSRKAGNTDPVLPFIRGEHIRLIGPPLPMQIDGEVGVYEETEICFAGRLNVWVGDSEKG